MYAHNEDSAEKYVISLSQVFDLSVLCSTFLVSLLLCVG